MKREKIYKLCKEEEQASFEGWNFSRIENRMITDTLPWSYREMAKRSLQKDMTLLDMGTGGGELLSSFTPLPEKTFATESYAPNIPIARRRLEPLGVEVREIYSDDVLPFSDNMFDKIINSHESYNVNELKRILKDGGEFITQQVGCYNLKELTEILQISPDTEIVRWNLEYAVNELKNAGFRIECSEEYYPETRFYDAGAVVYLAKVVPWQFPNFSVDSYFDKLCDINNLIEKNGFFATISHRFIITAIK